MLSSTFKNYKHLIVQSTTKEIDDINEFIFNSYAKKWAYLRSFFPVARSIQNNELSIKIYYHKYDIYGRREMEDFCSTCYREVIPKLKYSTCNIIGIPVSIEKKLIEEAILASNSMNELEAIYLNSLTDDSPVGCYGQGGGLTIYMLHVSRRFEYWNGLINNGYLSAEYEKKLKK